jgi:ribonuclease BN (tRNA processing enzyme)
MARPIIRIGLKLLVVWSIFLVQTGSADTNDNTDTNNANSNQGENRLTQIVLLGTGTPNADPERSGPALAIVVGDTPYIIDCGPGVVRRAAAAHKSGIDGLKVRNIKKLFVTHLHSDHTAGYSDLILTPWVLGRDEPLEVYGPDGIEHMTEHILAAYEQDIRVRLDGLEPANDQGHRVNTHNIEPGIIYKDSNVTVEAFAVTHGSWPEAYGFVFTTPDRRIVISGDAVPSDTLVAKAIDCDVLIHEVYSATMLEKRSDVWKKYHSSSHTSTYELGDLASRAKPGLVILYHQLRWGATDEDLLSEIKERYDGSVVSGRDLDVF